LKKLQTFHSCNHSQNTMAVLFILLSTALAGHGQGRRRIGDDSMTAAASEDANLCDTIHDYITSSEKRGKLLLEEMDAHGSNHGELTVTLEQMAHDVFDDCVDKEEAAGRNLRARRDLPDSRLFGLLEEAVEEDDDEFDQWYLDMLFKSATDRRRQENDDDELDKASFRQCQGYALMTVNLLRHNFMMGAATMVSTNTGSPKERIMGCGAVVNSVNAAIENGKILGVYIDGGQFKTKSSKIAQIFIKTVPIAVAGVFTLFGVCKSYAALALEA